MDSENGTVDWCQDLTLFNSLACSLDTTTRGEHLCICAGLIFLHWWRGQQLLSAYGRLQFRVCYAEVPDCQIVRLTGNLSSLK